jgi:hypothetical protein
MFSHIIVLIHCLNLTLLSLKLFKPRFSLALESPLTLLDLSYLLIVLQKMRHT